MAHLATYPREQINAALRDTWETAEFLRRLAASGADLPGLDAWHHGVNAAEHSGVPATTS